MGVSQRYFFRSVPVVRAAMVAADGVLLVIITTAGALSTLVGAVTGLITACIGLINALRKLRNTWRSAT